MVYHLHNSDKLLRNLKYNQSSEETGSSRKFDRKLNRVIREVQPCVEKSSSWCSEYYSATGCRIVLVRELKYIGWLGGMGVVQVRGKRIEEPNSLVSLPWGYLVIHPRLGNG
jgi:hypothetical protein